MWWKNIIFDGLQRGYGLRNGPTSFGPMRGFRGKNIINFERMTAELLTFDWPTHVQGSPTHARVLQNTLWRATLTGSLQLRLRTPIHCVHY